jgi:hypothetical protein
LKLGGKEDAHRGYASSLILESSHRAVVAGELLYA